MEKSTLGFCIYKIWQILKHFVGAKTLAKASYFCGVCTIIFYFQLTEIRKQMGENCVFTSGIRKPVFFQYLPSLNNIITTHIPVFGDNILTRDVLFTLIQERQKVIENEVHSRSDDFQVDNYNENLSINIDNRGKK